MPNYPFRVVPFQIGDIVMLRSGGPKMTIERVVMGICFCTWFDKQARQRNGQFDPDMLFLPKKPNAARRSAK